MNGVDIGQLIYLVLLCGVLSGYFLVSRRQNLGETARQAILWVIIFVGAIVVTSLWADLKDTLVPTQSVDGKTITAPLQSDGHYHLNLTIEGQDIEFIVDTGATDVVLSLQDAARIGIDTNTLIYDGRASTANGLVRTSSVTLRNVAVEGLDQGTLRASINEGDLETSLLGMTFLQRFSRVEITGDTLILEP
ncbi:MAG: TIGR02281 family clan AA aspartic protease [Litoreibacter sp.]